ncbi:MAG: hypothetical protein HUK24_00800 [Sphaerochaetaceae bacterium]|nr:hypothetical protein [Sphaerochaetaceae bacterium]
MDNRKKKNKGKKKPVEVIEPQRSHLQWDDVVVPKVCEPRPLCAICNEPIETIADAISEPEGRYSHFDCVIEKIKTQYDVKDPDKVSYIGRGNFGIVTQNEEGKYTIKETIPYENQEIFNGMKKFVEEQKQ